MSRNDLERHLSSKNVRNARSDFMAARLNADTATTPLPAMNYDVDSGEGSSTPDEYTSTESGLNKESHFSSGDLGTSMTEDKYITGTPSSFDHDKAASSAQQLLYDDDGVVGSMAESLIRRQNEDDGDYDSCCCCPRMRKYKGMWFLICTLAVLIMITTGIVLGTSEDVDDDTSSPTKPPTIAPTVYIDSSSLWCGISNHQASQECDTPCITGLDSECPTDQSCWSGVTTCSRNNELIPTSSSSSATVSPVMNTT